MAKKSLRQRSTNDCGITALAMLLGESYASIKREVVYYFATVRRCPFDGMCHLDDAAIAALYGERLKFWHVTAKNRKRVVAALQGRRAILGVPWGKSKGPGTIEHSVYWDGDELHDPGAKMWYHYGKNGARAFERMIYVAVLHSECENDSIEDC